MQNLNYSYSRTLKSLRMLIKVNEKDVKKNVCLLLKWYCYNNDNYLKFSAFVYFLTKKKKKKKKN